MDTGAVLAFWLVALLLIVVPGADWAFTLDAGLRRGVAPAVGGLAVGYLGLTAVVAAGVGALVASSPRALAVLTVVGGGYLVVHGLSTVARPPSGGSATTGEPAPASPARWLARGVAVSGLNPKGLVLFVALLPQFTDPAAAWPVAAQIGVLGGAFVVTCALFYGGLGSVAAGLLRHRAASARWVGRAAGLGMVLVGAGLVVERLVG